LQPLWGDIPDWVFDSVSSLMLSLRLSDSLTYNHCFRVGEGSRRFAEALGLNEYEQKVAEFSGLLHDVGKCGISKSILEKPARLDEREMKTMMEHPVLSAKIIEPLAHHQFFKDVMPGVLHHHERIDGLGYPYGLKDEQIPLFARLILIVDTYDAMTETRPYRKGLPKERVFDELQKFSGKQFDQALVKIFLESFVDWEKGLGRRPVILKAA
jgi:HD-GYP domain-containing protein (c-di-GMP phosphodiesterase class II)